MGSTIGTIPVSLWSTSGRFSRKCAVFSSLSKGDRLAEKRVAVPDGNGSGVMRTSGVA